MISGASTSGRSAAPGRPIEERLERTQAQSRCVADAQPGMNRDESSAKLVADHITMISFRYEEGDDQILRASHRWSACKTTPGAQEAESTQPECRDQRGVGSMGSRGTQQ